MASPPLSYPSPHAGAQKKQAPGSSSPFTLVEQVHASNLPPSLRNTLAAMLKFNRFGTELWPATLKVRIAAGVSYRSVQRHIDALVERKVLLEVYPANTLVRGRGFRRSATYRLDPSTLIPRQTWLQWLDSHPSLAPVTPIRPQSVREIPAQGSSSAPPPKRQNLRQLTSRERGKLVSLITQFMRGCTKVGEGLGRKLEPSDPEYMAPMDQRAALLEACKRLLIPIESAVEALKLAGFTMGEA
jgi:hypothetical protein